MGTLDEILSRNSVMHFGRLGCLPVNYSILEACRDDSAKSF